MTKNSVPDIQSPLYLHPSDGQNSIAIEKLTGSVNHREWRRSMEIALASKRKLGFVTGLTVKDSSDEQKADQWETCNSMQKEELRLFQFLTGIDDEQYDGMRTQILMKSPLPSVEEACNMLLQEEAQKENLKAVKSEGDPVALYTKGGNARTNENEEGCNVCGGKKHTSERCWKVIGYPKWHPMYKRQLKLKEGESGKKWHPKKGSKTERVAANAQAQGEQTTLTPQQIEQLLKLIPSSSKSEKPAYDTKDEIETNFAVV
ncbi:ABC transporter C family member 7 [Bienertia sinuspersici]